MLDQRKQDVAIRLSEQARRAWQIGQIREDRLRRYQEQLQRRRLLLGSTVLAALLTVAMLIAAFLLY
jgi:hypothetical protein